MEAKRIQMKTEWSHKETKRIHMEFQRMQMDPKRTP